ncbi:MAG: SPOR domain-containing protein [Thermoanaerobaculia bacterium]|nr:SPOR domain-containing protein [Thermoanaerobaculia bacterium]
MNDPRETSYYEIALTNRQVLVFFVVLLVCVVGAFFSGVWLGQRRAAEMPRIAQVDATSPETSESREPLEELNFFTEDPERSQPPRKRTLEPSGSPETTLLEDLRGAEADTAEPVRSEPTPPPTEPRPEPRRRTQSPATSEPVPTSEPTSTAAAEGFVIQVFSSPDGGQARKLLDRLVGGGYDAFLSPVEVEGRTMYRVRLGPLESRSAADRLAAEVGKAYQLDTWITRNE